MSGYRDSHQNDWIPSPEDDPVTTDIERRLHTAAEIDSRPAKVETLETYEDQINWYKSQGYTYIPIPSDGKYYNTEEGWLKEISTGMYISDDTHLMDVLRILQELPFLLVDLHGHSKSLIYTTDSGEKKLYWPSETPEEIENNTKILTPSNPEEFEINGENVEIHTHNRAKDQYPNLADTIDKLQKHQVENKGDFGIITLADVNRRGMKVMLYVVFSGLVSKLGHKVREEYPSSESLFKYLQPKTIGRWHKDRIEGLELHISEHMNLLELMQVIQASDSEFVRSCGFDSKGDVEALNSINEIRSWVSDCWWRHSAVSRMIWSASSPDLRRTRFRSCNALR